MKREIVLDSETTGIREDDEGPQRMISLGMIELIDGVKTGREREWFFNPERSCTRDAYNVHRIRDSWLAEQPLFRWALSEILDWLGEDIIIAHNAPFDRRFLNYEIANASGLARPLPSEMNRFPAEQWLDTVKLARRQFPKQPNSLDDLADRFGVYRGHRIKHGALKDARLLCDVLEHLRRGEQQGLFDALPEQKIGTVPITLPQGEFIPRNKPRSRLTLDEVKRHRLHIAEKIGADAVWYDYLERPDP